MDKVSVIIPARNELFLDKTIDDVFAKAAGDIEVIVILDGYWPESQLVDRDNLIIIHRGKSYGMRSGINSAASIAKGKYLMKCDAHCMFNIGFDQVLKETCEDNWVVIPARYSLDPENWEIKVTGKSRVDYHYLCSPYGRKEDDYGIHGVQWNERARARLDPIYDIDDEMSSQGSCWFMTKKHFDNFLGGLSEVGYGTFAQEFQEIGLKTWLGGGEVKINKKTWYAHLHKGTQYRRMYSMNRSRLVNNIHWSARYWMNNEWSDRKHDFSWLIEKFWPVPTWPEDRSLWVPR